MKVLLVEDDQNIADFVIKGLKQEGFTIDHAANGEDGLHLVLTETYDVAVIDIMLPKMDGLSLVEIVRKQKKTIPILILSAKSTVEDRVKGLQTGADDYLVKPFAFSELVARLQALIRRTGDVTQPNSLSLGEVTLDLHKRKVFVKGTEILLQPKEYILLEYLLRNQGRVISKTMIMEHVWDYNFDPQTNVVEAKISKLRSKLAESSNKEYIHTVKGLGYVCEERS